MHPQNLLLLRNLFEQHYILLAFNGLFSASLIEEIGLALRKHLEALSATPTEVTDVFTIYIELTQNIRHYSKKKGLSDERASGTITISREQNRYIINAGNVVEMADGEELFRRIHELARLDKLELKALWKNQMRQPRAPGASTGAGLGLIDMARKASQPLVASFNRLDENWGFFSLQVIL
ncbi:biofilm regulation protein kinase SiaB [Thauera butanivorans]|uniref:biofilm regulation protein kinase SiaB n=1 Tax=Thauera butanivorans TaxID=86174 RepID=UPI00083963E4|nr:biofilm regulation protein kinase SiaB [Thauera butanivorans]